MITWILRSIGALLVGIVLGAIIAGTIMHFSGAVSLDLPDWLGWFEDFAALIEDQFPDKPSVEFDPADPLDIR